MKTGIRLLLIWGIWGIMGSIAAVASVPSAPAGVSGNAASSTSAPAIIEVTRKPAGFRWKSALRESLYFLSIEHGFRLFQKKTRRELSGPFFGDYKASVKNLGGWGDGDSKFTNYVAHPMQGAAAGYIQIQNDPQGRGQEFGRSKRYWHSRLKAFAWAAAYSTQFELGPFSEATIGNVGKKKGTAGFTDLIVTPIAGLGMMVAEDALNRFVLRRLEARTTSPRKRAFYRVLLNPNRSFAGLLRGRLPWQREKGELRDAQRTSPELAPFDFSTPERDEEPLNDLLWPGMRCATGPNPHRPTPSQSAPQESG
ncbi:MAG: hypothetical protein ABSC21_15710 [Terriglobia bacterium]|jgi:hypothetical protein